MLNLSALDKVLKEVYVPAVRRQMQEATVLLSEIQRSSEGVDGSGKYAIIPIMLGYSEAVGARNEDEQLPTPKSTRYDRIQIPIRTNYGSIYVTGHAIRATQNDAGAYVRAVNSEMSNMVEGFKRDINRQMFGDGSGKLGTVTQYTAGDPSITVDDVLYFKVGMSISIYNSGLTTLRGTVTITNIDTTAKKVYLSATVAGVVANDVVVREGALNKEIDGLGKIISSAPYPTLNPINAPEWSANLLTKGQNEELTVAMQRAYTACEKVAGAPDLIITSFEVRDAYANSLTNLRRMVNTLELKFGRTAIAFNDRPLIADDQCPAGKMYFINKAHLVIVEASDFDWGDVDGKILDKVSGKDAYTAFMYWAANLATDRRNAHALLNGL